MAAPDPRSTAWLRLHGAPRLRLADGSTLALERKHAALLAYLRLEGPTPRGRLAALLWPDAGNERARGNLRQRLSRLRQEAGEIVLDDGGTLSLASSLLDDAPEGPGQPLLATLDYDDCDDLARWLEGRRESERSERRRTWLAEVRDAAQSMRLDDALFAADQLMETDRESEEAYRVLMEVFYLRGDHAAAISAWDRCRTMLRELYGVQPSAETRALGQSILEAARGEAPASPTPPSLPAAVLRPPQMVARGAAMAALGEGWARAEAMVVMGAAGLGKTRLLGEFMAAVGPCALAVGRPGDAVLPYATLSRLVMAALDRFRPVLALAEREPVARLLPRLAGTLELPASTAAAEGGGVRNELDRVQGILATARILGLCVRQGCAGFIVDDLQFVDAASVEALRLLAEPRPEEPAGTVARSAPLRFVFASRPEETGPAATALLDSLAATGRWRRIDLAPLDEGEAAELIGGLGVAGLDAAPLSRRIWRQVGGNPAFLLESLKLLLSLGDAARGAAAALPLPASIESVIARRIEMLTPRARHLAQLAAIAGNDFRIPLAASALACPVIELTEPMRELELRQVFYGRQFVHDVIAAVVLSGVPATVAEFMHRFVAEFLAAHDGEPAAIAGHWRACREWRSAGQQFRAASKGAHAAGRFREQGELLDAAIGCFENDPAAESELFDALLERVDAAEARAHPSLDEAEVVRLRSLARTPVQRLQALATEIGWHTDAARTDVPLEPVEAAVAEALALGRPDLSLQLAQTLSWQLAMRGRLDDSLAALLPHEPWATREADLRTRAVFHRTRAGVFGFCDRLSDAVGEGGRALAALRERQDWSAMLPAMANMGLVLHWRGEFEQARAVLEEARAIRERVQGRGSALMVDVHLGGVLRDLGETAAAIDLLEPVRAALAGAAPGDLGSRTERVIAENHLAEVWIARGDSTAARAFLASDDSGIGIRFRARRLTLALRVARLEGAPTEALRERLQDMLAQIDSPFIRILAELELAKSLPPAAAAAEAARIHDHPVAGQRPGLQLHAALFAAVAEQAAGRRRKALAWAGRARSLRAVCRAYDLPFDEDLRMLRTIADAA